MADDYQEKGYPRGYDVDEHLLEVTGPKILVDSEGEEERWVESEGEDGEEEDTITLSLFDHDTTFPTPSAALVDAKTKFGVDIDEIIANLKADFYSKLKIINFIRTCTKTKKSVFFPSKTFDSLEDLHSHMESHKSEALSLFIANANEILEGDKYLAAVFPNDPLIFHYTNQMSDDEDQEKGFSESSNDPELASLASHVADLKEKIEKDYGFSLDSLK